MVIAKLRKAVRKRRLLVYALIMASPWLYAGAASAMAAPINGGITNGSGNCQLNGFWQYTPKTLLNGQRGDAFLYSDQLDSAHRLGITSGFMIGFVFTHIGLLRDSYGHAVSNTVDIASLANSGSVLGSSVGGMHVDPAVLLRLSPGMSYQQVDDDYSGANPFGPHGVAGEQPTWRGGQAILAPNPTNSAARTAAQAATSWMESRAGHYPYVLYAFADTSVATSMLGGAGCSGTVWAASRAGSMPMTAPPNPSGTVYGRLMGIESLNIAQYVYNLVRPIVRDKIDGNFWSNIFAGTNTINAVSERLTDQVVNCFGSYQPMGCSNQSHEYVWSSERSLGIPLTSSMYNTYMNYPYIDTSAPIYNSAAHGVSPDHIALATGYPQYTNALGVTNNLNSIAVSGAETTEQGVYGSAAFYGAQEPWVSHVVPAASILGTAGNYVKGQINAGPWQQAALVTPSYSSYGGYWTYASYYTCMPIVSCSAGENCGGSCNTEADCGTSDDPTPLNEL